MAGLIDRYAAIDAIRKSTEAFTGFMEMEMYTEEDAIEAIEQLPSAQPERTGHWIHHPEWEVDGECGYECSECHMGSEIDTNYCPRCGAHMKGGEQK